MKPRLQHKVSMPEDGASLLPENGNCVTDRFCQPPETGNLSDSRLGNSRHTEFTLNSIIVCGIEKCSVSRQDGKKEWSGVRATKGKPYYFLLPRKK